MEAFFISFGLVALAELGDKTQLLAIVLAARFHRPWTIIAGIFAATVVNHLVTATVGDLVGNIFQGRIAHWALGAAFIAFAAWTLIPDKLDEDEAPPRSAHGVFWTTAVCFFMAEMGDKTQVATLALAARFHTILPVAAGTTLGMMLADGPAVFVSRAAAGRIPVGAIRIVAALSMAALGVWTIASG